MQCHFRQRMFIDSCVSTSRRARPRITTISLILTVVSFCAGPAQALDIRTNNGTKYERVTIIGVDGDGLRISHRFGVAKIPFEELPGSLKKQYHFDAATVTAYRKSEQRKKDAALASPAPRHLSSPPAVAVHTPAARYVVPDVDATPRPKIERDVAGGSSPDKIVPLGKSHQFNSAVPLNLIIPILIGAVVILIVLWLATKPRAPAKSAGMQSSPTLVSMMDRIHETQRRLSSVAAAEHYGAPNTNPGTVPQRPIRPDRSRSELKWRSAGQSIEHANLVLGDGMIYTSERPLPWPGEPSAIITSLSVAASAAHPLQEFGYWPAYDRISPEQRRCYLEWLASGRQDSEPSQRCLGYVFMFFYGLERRIILEGDRDPRLLEEIIRLLDLYGSAHKSRSLRTYFLQLLHFAGWQLGAEPYRDLLPRLMDLEGDRPNEDGLRFVLANLYQRGEALHWCVAYQLAFVNETSRRSAVVSRARDKFLALFQQRYSERFGSDFVPAAAKQDTVVPYRPASSVLAQLRHERGHARNFELRIPNVLGLHSQFKALPEIWNSCVEDLSGYSRTLSSRKQGRMSEVARWEALPSDLQKTEEHPLKAPLDEILAHTAREDEYTFVPVSALGTLLEISERPKLTSLQGRQLVEVLNHLGWQLAPDPQITGLALVWTQEVTIYPKVAVELVAENLSGLTRLLYLAVSIAAANGVIEGEELQAFYHIIEAQVANPIELTHLRATEAALRRDAHLPLRSLPQISKLVPNESREFVLRTMGYIAAADNQVTLDELKILRRIARAFDLDVNSVEKLFADESFREVTIANRRGASRDGEPIPSRHAPAAAFKLDDARIAALSQETREVISLLSAVMAEPDEAECAPTSLSPVAPAASPAVVPEWLTGLDSRYHDAVLALSRRDEITSYDFDCLAADSHLMPDDLLNTVNTWADETLGDFLLERTESVRIFRSLLPDASSLQIAA